MTQNKTDSTTTDILVTYKPSGLRSHRSNPQDWGYVEWLEQHLSQKLYLFQRLDIGTSGLMLIAKTEAAARLWTEKLQAKTLHKTYLFLTKASQNKMNETTVKSLIQKERGLWTSRNEEPSNSETHFKQLNAYGEFQLWQAQPVTGKSHQIRLHAQSLGLAILGDTEHGGAPFFRLCLHALRLEDSSNSQHWQMAAPPYFQQLELLKNETLCALIEASHQRRQLQALGLIPRDCIRLVHQESTKVRIDCFGEQNWVYDYQGQETQELLQIFYQFHEPAPTWIREMKNRGEQPNESQLTAALAPKSRWQAQENGLNFELRSDQGMSPGLFLDQRENRRWVQLNSSNLRVLNLFSYTCGFSVSAAAGGAKEVVSVDVSQRFLEWGKTNFTLNHLSPERYEFWASDSLEFLKRTAKIRRQFDLIICDPPSFGRSKRGVFRIDHDLSELVALIFPLLADGGLLLLSTNYEKWNQAQFEKEATKSLVKNSFELRQAPLPGLDFLETNLQTLKTLFLKKCS